MAVAASTIISRVRTQLVDTGSPPRWTDAELLQWLGDGERTIVAALPWACHRVDTVALAAGTRQSIPSDANRLLEVRRNLSAGGVPGAPCTLVDRAILDRQYLDWHLPETASPTVLHYTYDYNDPDTFYVYPYNDGTGSLEVHYSAVPTDLVSTASNINVRDIFATPLVDYVLFRAHQKDSDYAAGQTLASNYLQSFTQFIEIQSKTAQLRMGSIEP